MARTRTAKAPKPVEPEETSQELPDEDFLTPEQSIAQAEQENFTLNGSSGNVSKAQVVRDALSDGIEKPGEIVDYAKTRGVELTKMAASSYKAQIRAREAKGGESTPRTRSMSPAPPASIPLTFGEDIKQIKQLIEKAGSGEELKDLANSIAALVQRYGQQGFDSLVDAFE